MEEHISGESESAAAQKIIAWHAYQRTQLKFYLASCTVALLVDEHQTIGDRQLLMGIPLSLSLSLILYPAGF
jgi:hypothetical protein